MRLLFCLSLASVLAAQTVNYTYDSAGRLTGVAYPNGKAISYSYDPAGNVRQRVVLNSVGGAAPTSSAAAIANAASFQGGPVSPGELVTIYGAAMGPGTLAQGVLTSFGFFDTYLNESAVYFDGIPAPLIYVSVGQSTVIVPYAVGGKITTQMVIQYQGRKSTPITVPVVAAAPGLFAANAQGFGQGAILNADYSYNSQIPAAKGSFIQLFGTGEGQTLPAGIDGKPSNTVYPKPLLPISMSIGGIALTADQILYFGEAPTLVAGVFQIDAVIPAGVASGNIPVLVKIGNASTQSNLTVSVK